MHHLPHSYYTFPLFSRETDYFLVTNKCELDTYTQQFWINDKAKITTITF